MDTERPTHPMYPREPRSAFTPQYIGPYKQDNHPEETYFILRPPLLNQAIQDVKSQLSPDEDGALHGVWILTQVTHWGSECELLAFLTDHSLLFCYYDFVGLCSSRLLRVPLNYIDTVTWGPLVYPWTALNKRDGPALKVQWDKFRAEPAFLSRWNPWADDFPYIILTHHPGVTIKKKCTQIPKDKLHGGLAKGKEASAKIGMNQDLGSTIQINASTPPQNSTENDSTLPPGDSTESDPTLPTRVSTENDPTLPPEDSTENNSTLPTRDSPENNPTLPPRDSTEKNPTLPTRDSTENHPTLPPVDATENDPTLPPGDSTENDHVLSPEAKAQREPANPPHDTTQRDLHNMFLLEQFMEHVVEFVKRAHRVSPLPGRANGLLVLHRSVDIETSLGLVSFLSSRFQLGYAKSRGGFGF